MHLHNPDSSIHAAFIERFNRSFQSILYRYLTQNQTNRFVEVLSKLLKTYNTRYHRMIGTSPYRAENDSSVHLKMRMRALKYHNTIKQKPVGFEIGDSVRIAKLKNKFLRGYTEQFQHEIFKIKNIKSNSKIPMYTLETYDGGETLKGNFYSHELVKVSGDVFLVEKVLKKRKVKGFEQFFVKWKGFADNYNSWINADDIEKVF